MAKFSYITLLILAPLLSFGQIIIGNANKPHIHYSHKQFEGEDMLHLELSNIFIFPNNSKGRRMAKKYARLVNAIRVTYPVAMAAKLKLVETEQVIATMSNKERRKYMNEVEEEIKRDYSPVVRRISMYQGYVLLKLIDRLTGDTSYSLVKELKGGVSAMFWQGIARLFGSNLKTEYDPETEDAILEELVVLYEKGLI